MSPYEVLLSESQERMLIVVRPDAVEAVRATFDRYDLAAAEIGRITEEPLLRCRADGALVCELPGTALADDAPRYEIHGTPLASDDGGLESLAAERPGASVLLELLASANLRDRKPVWRQYDHMNGTNTLVGPGEGDAAVLRIKGTEAAIALAIDGPGPARVGALDPYLAGASAVLEAAMNVAVSGAMPIGITDCLNFGSPEADLGAWQLERAIDGIADACHALDIPVVSGNVSLYNETPEGPILPTPVVGMVGLLDDRRRMVSMTWRDGDEVWLLGAPADDADALAGSELAWSRGRRGGRPSLDLDRAARLVWILPRLARHGLISAAHDLSGGGLGAGLARVAIAAGVGARIGIGSERPSAALFGERGGRAIVTVGPERAPELEAALAAAGVAARRIGLVGGQDLEIETSPGHPPLRATVASLRVAWEQPF